MPWYLSQPTSYFHRLHHLFMHAWSVALGTRWCCWNHSNWVSSVAIHAAQLHTSSCCTAVSETFEGLPRRAGRPGQPRPQTSHFCRWPLHQPKVSLLSWPVHWNGKPRGQKACLRIGLRQSVLLIWCLQLYPIWQTLIRGSSL